MKLPYLSKGFTLIELLIVMTLLTVIALAVISAINPIEQANRARDSRFRTDGEQLISAIDRYFVARSEFPWMTNDPATFDSETSFGYANAATPGVGICGDASCSSAGPLITSDELRPEFRTRDFIKKASENDETIFIGKDEGSTSSIYACFIPLSKASRKNAVEEDKVYTLDVSNGTRTQTAACDADNANWTANNCYVCIPE